MNLVLPQKQSTLVADLRRMLKVTQVKDDVASLQAYAVDASIYKIRPQVIVLPESESDIDAVMMYAVRMGVPVTPRAAGTNLTGSAIGKGIILDVSRLNKILELNVEERWARVQPGIVLNEMNKQLARSGLLFGPDPSSGDMCKLGGMLANNSAGPHTLRYGAVKDNVRALRVWLETGGWHDAQPYELMDPGYAHHLAETPALRSVLNLIHDHRKLIQSKRPQVTKNSAGYNVFDVADGIERGLFDVPKLFIGSEGTLGVFSEATIQLVDLPRHTITGLIHFQHLDDVGAAVHALLSLQPSALEIMDANTLNLIGRHRYGIPSDADATLLIEFDQDQDSDRSAQLLKLCRPYQLAADPVMAFSREQQANLWQARKALYPTLYQYSASKKPINFVDDVVVSAEQTGELVRYLESVFGPHHVPVAIFGHIGNGNAHIVPLLDVNDAQDFTRMVEGYYEIHQTVLTRFGGSICGEHGDGRIRAEMVRSMFGEDLYAVFVKIKEAFDPAGILNPGVKISDVAFTQDIDFERLGKPCATCAKCNAVCPVYDVFQSEDMSARGWYEIVTDKTYAYVQSKRVVEACLNCKSCRTACPAGVDVSELILARRAENPNSMVGMLLAVHARTWLLEPILKCAAWLQPFWDQPWFRRVLEPLSHFVMKGLAETAKIPRDMELPRLAKRFFRERHRALCLDPHQPQSSVAYFHGCAANYFDDGVGDAVIKVLRRYGVVPDLPPQRCSGTPIDTYGYRALAKEGARFNLESLSSYDTIVTGCASCTLALKDYPRLFTDEPENETAQRVARHVKHISEYVLELEKKTIKTAPPIQSKASLQTVTYHSSCHLRAAGVTRAPRELLSHIPGITLVDMEDAERCAGGAGTYIIKDYETSQRIFQRKQAAIHNSGATTVATSCPACMIQLKNGMKGEVVVKHVAQVLADSFERDAAAD